MRRLWHGLAVLLLAVFGAGVAKADERILSYRSTIEVQPDATVLVTEDIQFWVEGKQVKRGILRDFPTRYRNRLGIEMNVGFVVLEVRRNGQPEPFKIEKLYNGKRIRIGRSHALLDHGIHTYTISYRTTRQLGFFEEFDELYWNVTGNGWTFPIDSVEASVKLPPGASVTRSAAYTGSFANRGTAYSAASTGDGQMVFRTTQPLRRAHGLTIAVAWPKGHVSPPSIEEGLWFGVQDNKALSASGLGLLVVSAYYLLVWWIIGRDRRSGTIIPRFEPPAGMSPAAVGFVSRMALHRTAFTAAVVSMATKGKLSIIEDNSGFTLERHRSSSTGLPLGEKALFRALFREGRSIAVSPENHEELEQARKSLRDALRDEYEGVALKQNRIWYYGGVGLSILMLLLSMKFSEQEGGYILLFVAFFSAIALACWLPTIAALRWLTIALMTGRGLLGAFLNLLRSLRIVIAALAFTGILVVFFLSEEFGILPAVPAIYVILNALFLRLIRAPTVTGRALMDEIDGFKLYLSKTHVDGDEPNLTPDQAPVLFEKMLPYAIALGVEQAWSARFGMLFNAANQTFRPSWYHGVGGHALDGGALSSGIVRALGPGLTMAIASSVGASGRVSGSGGGGFSGGGGGGGGGSGW